MIADTATSGLTFRAALFDSDEDAQAALTGALTSGGLGDRLRDAVSDLSAALGAAAVHRLAVAAAGLLQMDVGSALVAGWQGHTALHDAGRSTLADPAAEELVELAAHTIEWEHLPYVELIVGTTSVLTVTLTLRCTIDVDSLVAQVADGHLIGVQAGDCRGTLMLGVAGDELIRRPVHLDLAASLRLRRPIRLARDAQPAVSGTSLP